MFGNFEFYIIIGFVFIPAFIPDYAID